MATPEDIEVNSDFHRPATLALGVGLLFLGILVGTLMAMSAQSVVKSVIASVFALFGGSLIALLQKVSVRDQIKAGLGMLGLSLGTLVGVYSGLLVNNYQLLTPADKRRVEITNVGASSPETAKVPALTQAAASVQTSCDPKYLRSMVIPPATAIDQKYRTKAISGDDAYAQLRSVMEKSVQ